MQLVLRENYARQIAAASASVGIEHSTEQVAVFLRKWASAVLSA